MEKLVKGLSIFFSFILFFSVIAFSCCDYDDHILDNKVFLIQDTYKVFLNDRILYSVFIQIDPIISFILTHAIFVRGPPV